MDPQSCCMCYAYTWRLRALSCSTVSPVLAFLWACHTTHAFHTRLVLCHSNFREDHGVILVEGARHGVRWEDDSSFNFSPKGLSTHQKKPKPSHQNAQIVYIYNIYHARHACLLPNISKPLGISHDQSRFLRGVAGRICFVLQV